MLNMINSDEYSSLSITLNDEQLKALGFSLLPAPGEEVMINARCRVVRTNETNDPQGANKSITLQITDLELSNAPDTAQSTIAALYS